MRKVVRLASCRSRRYEVLYPTGNVLYAVPKHIQQPCPTRSCPATLHRRLSKSVLRQASHGSSIQQAYSSQAPNQFYDPTIYALSTGSGRAGIAVVRISGASCLDILKSLCPVQPVPKPRYAAVRTLYHPLSSQDILDSEALVLYFPGPKTVTGEDVLELHVHGGPATVKAVLSAIPKSQSASQIRYAEPGEFTRRAFQNNRLDLAQVEALSDVLSAETEVQRKAAVRGHSGDLGRIYEKWRHQLLYARGEVEAFIDFYEDQSFEDEEADMLRSIEIQIKAIQGSIAVHIEAGKRGELLRKGIRISMLGPPNAGKSSLLNQLVRREASIVSSEAGTTRDIVEVNLDIEGYLCTIADTAGLRTASEHPGIVGEIEAEGIRRAKAKATQSDLVITFASIETDLRGVLKLSYDEEALMLAMRAEHYVVVINKMDLIDQAQLAALMTEFSAAYPDVPKDQLIPISCKADTITQHSPQALQTGSSGIKVLMDTLVTSFKDMTIHDQEELYGVTARQNQLLHECGRALENYLMEAENRSNGEDVDIVLAAEYLRTAAACLGRITGRGDAGDVEEVLGVVFEKFCVGK